jgi:hypothetical protein
MRSCRLASGRTSTLRRNALAGASLCSAPPGRSSSTFGCRAQPRLMRLESHSPFCRQPKPLSRNQRRSRSRWAFYPIGASKSVSRHSLSQGRAYSASGFRPPSVRNGPCAVSPQNR